MQPDILTCAKALSEQLPAHLGGDGERARLRRPGRRLASLGTFGHGFTYSGHPVPAAVAVETLKIYDEMDIVGPRPPHGPPPAGRPALPLRRSPLVGEIRGTGLIAAVEFVEDKPARRNFDPSRKVAPRFTKVAESHGLIMRALPGDGIAFSPPLIIKADEIEEMLERFGRALDEFAVTLRRESLAPV
jgi:4-aminobutyrate--pyruvate transaminase